MNETLAAILAARLSAALPFLDRVTGLARLLQKPALDGDTPVTLKLPVPVTFTAEDCDRNDQYLVPAPGPVGIAFFEDNGGGLITPADNLGQRTASLKLLLWLDPRRLDGGLSEVALTALVERALAVGQRYAAAPFLDIYTTATILPSEASLYGRYSFAASPNLLPPYRVLGMNLTVQYRVNLKCLPATLPQVINAPAC